MYSAYVHRFIFEKDRQAAGSSAEQALKHTASAMLSRTHRTQHVNLTIFIAFHCLICQVFTLSTLFCPLNLQVLHRTKSRTGPQQLL